MLELIITCIVLGTLAALIVPAAKAMIQDAKVAKILSTYNTIKLASKAFLADTMRWPSNIDQLWQNAATPIPGWNGPYLERPIGFEDHPFGGFIDVISPTTGSSADWSSTIFPAYFDALLGQAGFVKTNCGDSTGTKAQAAVLFQILPFTGKPNPPGYPTVYTPAMQAEVLQFQLAVNNALDPDEISAGCNPAIAGMVCYGGGIYIGIF